MSKAVQRLTWDNEHFTGDYLDGYSVTHSNCTVPIPNGVEEAGAPSGRPDGFVPALESPGPAAAVERPFEPKNNSSGDFDALARRL